jgi:hypothetical protein
VRRDLDRAKLRELMEALARSVRGRGAFRVYLVGGGTAIWAGWRDSTIDADLHCEREEIFRDIQEIKERLGLNVELVRPEDFVPALAGSETRHVFLESFGNVELFHYDPYAQLFSKIVRGFEKDVEDGERFLESGMVEREAFHSLVRGIPKSAWALYPALSRDAVEKAVAAFLSARPG